MTQPVSRRGARFVARFEGFRSCPYWDPYGQVWTVGYGETQGITAGSPCVSKRSARKDLRKRLSGKYNPTRLQPQKLKQCEIDALASLAYNEGPGILSDPSYSTLAKRLRSNEGRTYNGRKRIYRQELPKWTRSGGVVLAGLVNRRNAEVRLATTGHYH